MSFQPGERVGDYEVLGTLGAGGMGRVYKVRNVISDRVEALKVLLPNLEADPDLAERFLREIKVQASLNHPNIAQLYTAVRAQNQLLMLMEFVEGQTFEQMLHHGPIPLAQGLDALCQVCAALAYAHSHGVIHRDIKPANIMLTPQGVVKLMDFGIARPTADRRLTQSGQTVGSLHYMSPEQIRGSEMDYRADLYSLGISMYEVVTGRRPFQGDSEFSIMAAHLQQMPTPPIQLDPALPPALSEIILTTISKDPAQRFQSADALRKALLAVIEELKRGPQQRMAQPVAPAMMPVQPPPQQYAPAPATPPPGYGMAPPAPYPPQAPYAPAPVTPPPGYGQAMPTPPSGYSPAAMAPSPNVQARPSSGRRGLYMALGSLLTLAVLVVAITQIPKWKKASAAASSQQQQQQQLVSPPPVQQQPPPSQEQPPQVTPTSGQESNATAPQQQQASHTPPKPREHESHRTTAPPQQQVVAPPQQQQPQQQQPQQSYDNPPPQQPQQQPLQPNRAELRAMRERMMLMATRAGAVRSTIAGIEREQARQGLNLHPEVKEAQNRFVLFMDQAEADLKEGDLAGAKSALEKAEMALERLERFAGRN